MKKHEHRWRESGQSRRVECETCHVKGTLGPDWRVTIDGENDPPAFLKRGTREPYGFEDFRKLLAWRPRQVK
jgi:hypothetical protein